MGAISHTEALPAAVQLPRFPAVYQCKSIRILWGLEEGAAMKPIQIE